jgi:1-aminocyclopropane-1-carboxylate synthase
MANHANKHFDPSAPIQAEDITWACGVTALNEMISLALCDKDEAILIGSTVYGSFNKDICLRTGSVKRSSSWTD